MSVSPDIQATFDYLFAAAAKALQANQSFEPFATATSVRGQRTHSTTDLGSIITSPTEHISALLATLKGQADKAEIRTAGVVFNARTPADMKGGEDSVVIHAETLAGEAVQIFVPYTRKGVPKPAFAQPIIQDVPARIFPR